MGATILQQMIAARPRTISLTGEPAEDDLDRITLDVYVNNPASSGVPDVIRHWDVVRLFHNVLAGGHWTERHSSVAELAFATLPGITADTLLEPLRTVGAHGWVEFDASWHDRIEPMLASFDGPRVTVPSGESTSRRLVELERSLRRHGEQVSCHNESVWRFTGLYLRLCEQPASAVANLDQMYANDSRGDAWLASCARILCHHPHTGALVGQRNAVDLLGALAAFPHTAAFEQLCSTIDDDVWETLLVLAPNWHGRWDDLVSAAGDLTS